MMNMDMLIGMDSLQKLVWVIVLSIVLFGFFGCLNILLSIPAIQKYNKLVVILETAVKIVVLLTMLLAAIVTINFIRS
jgi:hypothetical protein